MNMQTRKLRLIQSILVEEDEAIFDELEAILNYSDAQNKVLKQKLTARALKAEDDIRNKRFNSRDEVEAKLKARFS